MTKFTLIVLVAIFGGLLFVLGILAPDSVRRPVLSLTQKLDAVRPAQKTPAEASPAKPATPGAKQQEPPPILYQSLLIPSPPPPDGSYALQICRCSTQSKADELLKRAQDSGFNASAITVQESTGERWTAIAAGRYNSPDDARAARLSMASTLELTEGMPVIHLPSP